MKNILFYTIILVLLNAFSQPLFAQTDKDIYRADKYFSIKNYQEAQKIYQKVVDAGNTDPVTNYRLGYCYFQSNELEQKIKSIPYLTKAVGKTSRDIPVSLYFDLAQAYHFNSEIDNALEMYNEYKKNVKTNKSELDLTDKWMAQASNARFHLKALNNHVIKAFPGNVNSSATEYNPVVSADESVMAYTAVRKDEKSGNLVEQIMISYNESGSWSEPTVVDLKASGNLGTAGLSPDGQQMMVFIGLSNGVGNLYTVARNGNDWENPVVLGSNINSRFVESTASITPDGKTMYFASNKPGGYGGFDIYKSEKDNSGNWGRPVNLGPRVNSKYDEDAPFIHPDQVTLFFTSDGINSMGGRDIFRVKMVNGEWTKPYNMGYPVNTTANDNYFTLTADGKKGYFSSDRIGGQGGQDIYSIDMPDGDSSIPLTLLKGRILNGETMKPLPTKIFMVDNEDGKKLDFVYNPNPKTGDYLIILPPNKNYDMIIECEDFLPYTLNINIPNQNYFYELYQIIYLNTIKQFDVPVGQEVVVKNAFYDTNQDATENMKMAHEAALIQSDSIDAYELMADLMAAGDQDAIDYLLELIAMDNPIDNVNFDASQNDNLEAADRIYYYDESDESKFEKKEVDGRVIFSLPTFYVTEEAKRQKEEKNKKTNVDPAVLNTTAKVYFDIGKSELNAKYYSQLDKILKLLNENPDVYVEISGYASSDGTDEQNREISNKRAISVLEYLNHKGVVRRRIIARGYGATKVESVSKDESRRVEVRIVATPSKNM
ncbi:MAG: OmpA family protein [Cyclobacteriaceae bacterium]|nr:OmpA family protein [Cyclobacteriaceae bacterium]